MLLIVKPEPDGRHGKFGVPKAFMLNVTIKSCACAVVSVGPVTEVPTPLDEIAADGKLESKTAALTPVNAAQ